MLCHPGVEPLETGPLRITLDQTDHQLGFMIHNRDGLHSWTAPKALPPDLRTVGMVRFGRRLGFVGALARAEAEMMAPPAGEVEAAGQLAGSGRRRGPTAG